MFDLIFYVIGNFQSFVLCDAVSLVNKRITSILVFFGWSTFCRFHIRLRPNRTNATCKWHMSRILFYDYKKKQPKIQTNPFGILEWREGQQCCTIGVIRIEKLKIKS